MCTSKFILKENNMVKIVLSVAALAAVGFIGYKAAEKKTRSNCYCFDL